MHVFFFSHHLPTYLPAGRLAHTS